MSIIELYESADGSISLEVRADSKTVWLSLDQMAALFGRNKSTISRHLTNLFTEGELLRESVVANFATTGTDGKSYQVAHYTLDVIISVGYRVKSAQGVQFRQWATGVLRNYLLEGVATNERRLKELGQIVQILGRSSDEVLAGVADVLTTYVPGLTMLRDYDNGQLGAKPKAVPGWVLTLEEARQVITQVAAEFPDDGLLGNERGDALEGIVSTLYQGFAGQELYPTVEEKASNLLYLVVKDHPLSDGNKRSAAALFVTFLAKNGILEGASGASRITNNALAAITLMVAMSDPKEKDLMVELIVRMLAEAAP
mgnify:CR=1 FL=1